MRRNIFRTFESIPLLQERVCADSPRATRRYAVVKAAILVALVSFVGCPIAAQAHQINLTNARLLVLADRTVDVEVAMKGSDADRAVGTKVFDDATGLVQPAALAAASAP